MQHRCHGAGCIYLSALLGCVECPECLSAAKAAFLKATPPLQCHMKFYALVCDVLARERPNLLKSHIANRQPGPPRQPRWAAAEWASPREFVVEIENNLALVVRLLHHNQTVAALGLSQHIAAALGWDWQGQAAHLTALGGGFAPCWDEMTLLATLTYDAVSVGEPR